MSMKHWAVRAVAGATMVLAFGAAHANTSIAPITGVFSLASGTASEVTSASPALPQMQMADLVINAPSMVLQTRMPSDVIHHPDQGSQGEFNQSSQHVLFGGAEGE